MGSTMKLNTKYKPVNQLTLSRLRLPVHLGWTDEERAVPQLVEANLFIRFPEPPPACQTDELKDTVCYAEICEKLSQGLEGRSFKLIERLAAHFYSTVKEALQSQSLAEAQVQVEVMKINVPIENLMGGTSFTYGDHWGDEE